MEGGKNVEGFSVWSDGRVTEAAVARPGCAGEAEGTPLPPGNWSLCVLQRESLRQSATTGLILAAGAAEFKLAHNLLSTPNTCTRVPRHTDIPHPGPPLTSTHYIHIVYVWPPHHYRQSPYSLPAQALCGSHEGPAHPYITHHTALPPSPPNTQ